MAICTDCERIVEAEHMDCPICEGELCSFCCEEDEAAWQIYKEKEIKD